MCTIGDDPANEEGAKLYYATPRATGPYHQGECQDLGDITGQVVK